MPGQTLPWHWPWAMGRGPWTVGRGPWADTKERQGKAQEGCIQFTASIISLAWKLVKFRTRSSYILLDIAS